MDAKYQYLFKNVGILTLSNFASKVMVFLLVPIYTNVLSTGDYGVYDITISTVTMLYPVLSVNIIDAVMRFLMDKNGQEEQIASIGFKISLIGCVLASLLILIIDRFQIFSAIRGLEVLIFLYFVFYSFNQYFVQLAKGLERVSDMAIASVMGIAVMLVMNILFLLVFKLGLRGFFIANILSQAIPAGYYIIRLKFWEYRLFVKSSKKLRREMVAYSFPLVATSLGWSINNAGDKYVVTFILGVGANGLLAVAYKIPAILNILQSIFISAWQISGVKEYGGDEAEGFYCQVFLTINLLMCFACSGLILLSKMIAHLLYAKDFFEAWRYVPFLLISSVFNCASGVLGPILSAQKNSKSMASSAIWGIVANLVLNVILAYVLGIKGVTIATAISSLVIYILRKKAVGSVVAIPHYWKVIVTWVLLCVQAYVAIWTGVWYTELIIMVAIVLVNLEFIRPVSASVKYLLTKGH